MTNTEPEPYVSYVVTNAIVRSATSNAIALVLQRKKNRPNPFWSLPGGKVDPGESMHDALARELREETGLTYHGDVTLAYSVHYLMPDARAVIHVFDGIGFGEPAPQDPDGQIEMAEFVSLEDAVLRLAGDPRTHQRDPAIAYLRGECAPGTFWSYEHPHVGAGEPVRISPLRKNP